MFFINMINCYLSLKGHIGQTKKMAGKVMKKMTHEILNISKGVASF